MTADDMAAIHMLCFVTPRPYKAAEIANILRGIGAFAIEDPHGFLIGRVVADEAELITLAVHPDHRRQGIARTLIDSFIGTSHRLGARVAFLEVAETNQAAKALYESFEFSQNSRRKGYYKTPDGTRLDAITMMRTL